MVAGALWHSKSLKLRVSRIPLPPAPQRGFCLYQYAGLSRPSVRQNAPGDGRKEQTRGWKAALTLPQACAREQFRDGCSAGVTFPGHIGQGTDGCRNS